MENGLIALTVNETALKERFDKAMATVLSLKSQAEELKVESDDDQETATGMATQARTIFNKIEKRRKELKAPIVNAGKTLDGMASPIKKILQDIQNNLAIKIQEYQIEIERIAEEQRKAAEKAAEEQRKAAEEKARKAAENDIPPDLAPEPDEIIVPEVAAAPKKVVTSAGSSTVKDVLKHRLIDISKVPSEYLLLNDRAVVAAIDRGVRDIPGIEIYKDKQVRFTARRG